MHTLIILLSHEKGNPLSFKVLVRPYRDIRNDVFRSESELVGVDAGPETPTREKEILKDQTSGWLIDRPSTDLDRLPEKERNCFKEFARWPRS